MHGVANAMSGSVFSEISLYKTNEIHIYVGCLLHPTLE
jgi:hypothetical protein